MIPGYVLALWLAGAGGGASAGPRPRPAPQDLSRRLGVVTHPRDGCTVLRLSGRSGEPLSGRRRWHDHQPLGHDTEPTCQEAEWRE